jgi:aromatic ring-opening dioxygenase catalytic subunit (LigB family)
MAEIVFAVGSSHGPTIQSPAESWARLGDGDQRDPRFNYRELLAAARPGLDQEITIEVQRVRHKAARTALASLTQRIADARPDVVVVVSNAHRIRRTEPHPVFAVLRAEQLPVVERAMEGYDPDARFAAGKSPHPPAPASDMPGHPGLATHLIEGLIEDGFDVACIDRLPEGAVLDDAFSFSYEWLFAGRHVPVVPLLLSRDLPNQANSGRCYDLGVALRRRIDSFPHDLRVGLLASGGLSHQVIDEELDRSVIAALVGGNAEVMRSLPRARLNRAPGTPEILNWVAVAAAMAPRTMTLVDYLPCYRSLAGTGHGVTFGYWA